MINTKEETESIRDAFEGENMQTHYSVLGYKIDLYFHDYKLEVEIDEIDDSDRNNNNKTKEEVEEELNCEFIRINPDEANFNGKKLWKNSSKKSLIENLSKRLSELQFKSDHSIKLECLRHIVDKILPTL